MSGTATAAPVPHHLAVEDAPAGMAARAETRARTLWLALAMSGLVLCYLPVMFFEYGVADDYRLLAFYDRGFTNRTLMIAEGRPLQALWTNLVFAPFHGISSLATLRLLTILSWAFVAWLLASVWRRAGLQWREATMATVAMLTLPAYQVFTSSGGMGAIPFAVLFAVAAGLFAEESARHVAHASRMGSGSVAVLFLVCALLIYQPAAMMYWVVTAILLLLPEHGGNELRRRLLHYPTIAFVALSIGYVAYRIGASMYGSDLVGTQRNALAPDPVAKVLWFLRVPLQESLNLWNIFPAPLLGFGVGILVSIGLILHCWRSRSQAWIKLLIAVALVPLAYLPNLLTAENWPAYRTQTALSSLVFAYLVIALSSQMRVRRNRLYPAILPGLALGGAVIAAYNVTAYCAIPAARELSVVREWMQTLDTLPPHYSVKRAGYSDALIPYIRYEEFGIPQTAQPWTAADLPYLIVRERRPDLSSSQIAIGLVRDASEATGTFVDWGHVLRSSRFRPKP